MRAEINQKLRSLLASDKRYLIIGESVCDPYGGAAKVTRGLSTKYPDQVIDTPISEDAILGVSWGLAINGFIPIVEIMFFDFMTLCMNQLLNVGKKLDSLHNIDFKVIIRTMKAPPEYGPTHSQDLCNVLTSIGIPHVWILRGGVSDAYDDAIKSKDKIIVFIEDKKLY
jgi:2-oxoisovalerate dehydrogenase E1 component